MAELTWDVLEASFEAGGLASVWVDVQAAMIEAKAEGYKEGEYQWRDTSRRFRRFWTGFGEKAGAAFDALIGLLVLAIIGSGIYFIAAYQIKEGGKELAACSRGQTLPCQAAVDNAGGSAYKRVPLYKTAYKQATGHDLPKMEAE